MKRAHFIGIGGAGMAPLAEILLRRGARISGSDREANAKTARLAQTGAEIFIGHDAAHLPPDAEIVIRSSAVGEKNPELRQARKLGIETVRRGEFLARLADTWPRPAAVSGSHGKTSITAMLVHILCKAGKNPAFLIGGSVPGAPSSSPGGEPDDLFVTEADESDGTHTLLHPALGIVPNVDDDHSWSVGGVEALHGNFRTFARNCRRLIYGASPTTDALFAEHPAALRLELPPPEAHRGRWTGFALCNAMLACRAAAELGVPEPEAWRLLEDFPGVARRMTLHWNAPDLRIIEDYAHHPEELAAAITMLQSQNPGFHLRILFQPHRYARLTRHLERLAAELKRADSAFVAPVFAAWSETGPVGSAELAAAAGARELGGDWSAAARELLRNRPQKPLLIAVIGAGDVEKILPELKKLASEACAGS